MYSSLCWFKGCIKDLFGGGDCGGDLFSVVFFLFIVIEKCWVGFFIFFFIEMYWNKE